MLLTAARFNFASTDLAVEERHYLDHHVALARQLPGLRCYYTGRLVAMADQQPDRHRAAILLFDNEDARAAAMRTATGAALGADTRAHLSDLARLAAEAEVIVPFETRRPGQAPFVMFAAFDLAGEPGGDVAEHRYRDRHVALARRLPGLRHYVIGKLVRGGGAEPERYRLAIIAFDTREALREAYRSPLGRELREDERATIVNARVWGLDARVEV